MCETTHGQALAEVMIAQDRTRNSHLQIGKVTSPVATQRAAEQRSLSGSLKGCCELSNIGEVRIAGSGLVFRLASPPNFSDEYNVPFTFSEISTGIVYF